MEILLCKYQADTTLRTILTSLKVGQLNIMYLMIRCSRSTGTIQKVFLYNERQNLKPLDLPGLQKRQEGEKQIN